MQRMSTTRLIFFLIVGLALVIVCAALAFNFVLKPGLGAATATPAEVRPVTTSGTTPQVNLKSPEPVYAPNRDAKDGLPTYICGADAFGSYYTLQQMQMSGK